MTTVTKQLFFLDLPGVKLQGGLLPLTAEKLQTNDGTLIAERGPSATLIPTETNQNQYGAGNYDV